MEICSAFALVSHGVQGQQYNSQRSPPKIIDAAYISNESVNFILQIKTVQQNNQNETHATLQI